MVFSSIPVYLHAPSWQQQPIQHVGENYRSDNPHQLLHQPLPPEAHHVAGGVAGTCKPGSMSDRARQANIPQPEAGLKCPRCESTNTKFCYFNNYSLSQPRHFCKGCRRYWTRGGALRNVPVGGGSRRNKKNKRSRSKSPAATDDRQAISNPDGQNINIVSRSYTSDLIMSQLPQPPQLPPMTSLQNINSHYGVGNVELNNVGAQIQIHADPQGYHMGNASSTADQQWRFPFLLSTTFGSPASIGTSYQFQSHQTVETPPAMALVGDNPLGTLISNSTVTTATRATTDQLPPVKYEDHRAINLTTSLLPSFPANGNQYWGTGNSWIDMSALNSSSTSHLL